MSTADRRTPHDGLNRRSFLTAALGGMAFGAAGAGVAAQQPPAQQPPAPQIPPPPTPRDWSRQDPVQYPDPDIVALNNRFRRYIVNNTVIRRLHFGTLWSEGP